jgi:NAD(P)-dependent dehydrogenase (short-subunit alcohol dehydrogenase family)
MVALAEMASTRLGRLDVLVSNAGIGPISRFDEPLAGVSATCSSFEMVEYRARTSISIPTIPERMRRAFDGARTVSGEVDNHS